MRVDDLEGMSYLKSLVVPDLIRDLFWTGKLLPRGHKIPGLAMLARDDEIIIIQPRWRDGSALCH